MELEFKFIEEEVNLLLRNTIEKKDLEFKAPSHFKDENLTPKEFQEGKLKIINKELIKYFDDLFTMETHRIKKSIPQNYLNLDTEKFEKYIIVNYKNLIELKNDYDLNKFYILQKDGLFNTLDLFRNEMTFWEIKSMSQSDFVRPWIKYFEDNYKVILINYNVLSSPIDNFIDVISKFYSEVSINKNYQDDWKHQLDSGNLSVLTVSLNGFVNLMIYKKYLQDIYNEFKNYIDFIIEEASSVDKLNKQLLKLKIKLDELASSYKIEKVSKYENLDTDLTNNINMMVNADPELANHPRIPGSYSYLNNLNNMLNTQYIITKNSLTFINSQLEYLKLLSSSNQDISSKTKQAKIKWNGDPQEFTKLFADLIFSEKLILDKTHNNTEPIVKLLHQFFSIPKKKGDGVISLNSLSTYFKEYNSNRPRD